jgi:heterodisulfide reductase subunit B2
MKFAFFPGCKIPYFLEQYGTATRAVLARCKIKLVGLEFTCCGYPVHHLNFEAFVLSAARNLALAEKHGLNILTPCKCCYGSLKHADHWLRERKWLRREINRELEREGLCWKGDTEIRHLLTVLAEDVGFQALGEKIKKPFSGLRVAASYGCHALRPGNIVRFDNPLAPTIFEKLVAVTGAECVEWARRLECCGHPLWEKNNELSLKLLEVKLSDARQSGADLICTACTYCQMQFDTVQAGRPEAGTGGGLPAILYPQLLGWSMGLPERVLGLNKNRLPVQGIRRFLREASQG